MSRRNATFALTLLLTLGVFSLAFGQAVVTGVVVAPRTVVANEPFGVRVYNEQGAVLAGAVVDIDGQQVKTDSEGRATVQAAKRTGEVAVRVGQAVTNLVAIGRGGPAPLQPSLKPPSGFLQTGQEWHFQGDGFRPGSVVRFAKPGGEVVRDARPDAWSAVECVVKDGVASGAEYDVSVVNPDGSSSDVYRIGVYSLNLEGLRPVARPGDEIPVIAKTDAPDGTEISFKITKGSDVVTIKDVGDSQVLRAAQGKAPVTLKAQRVGNYTLTATLPQEQQEDENTCSGAETVHEETGTATAGVDKTAWPFLSLEDIAVRRAKAKAAKWCEEAFCGKKKCPAPKKCLVKESRVKHKGGTRTFGAGGTVTVTRRFLCKCKCRE